MMTLDKFIAEREGEDASRGAYNLIVFARRVTESLTDEQLNTFIEEGLGDCEFDIGWSGKGDEYRARLLTEIGRAEAAIGRVVRQ